MSESTLTDINHNEIDITDMNTSDETYTSEIKDEFKREKKEDIDPNHINIKLPKKQFYIVLISLLICMAMASIDITIVAAALPVITAEFNTQDNYTWVIVAYLLANTSLQPTCGKLADIFGRKLLIILALLIFLVSSLVCGASTGFYMLVISRAVQGASGGCLASLANIICSDIVPIKKRGTYLGLLNSAFSLALAIGPLIGGIFTDAISWRWAFFINIPLCLISMFGIGFNVKIPLPPGTLFEKVKRIDFVGTIFLIVTVVSLLLALNWGGSRFKWSSKVILFLLGSFLFLLCCFLFVEYKLAREPIIPLYMFKSKNLCICIIISFMSGVIFITFNNTFSMLYQDGRGYSATMSGLRIAPAFITVAISSVCTGWLNQKFGHIREFTIMGTFSLFFSCLFLSYIKENTSFFVEFLIYLFYGLCIAIPLQYSLVLAQISAPLKLNAISTAVTLFFRMIGGVIGIAIFGMVIKNKFINSYKEAYPKIKNVSVNNLHNLENGPHYYVKAIDFAYRATFLPPIFIMFILSFCLTKLKYLDKINKRRSFENSDTHQRNKHYSYDNSISNEFNLNPSINHNQVYIINYD